MTLYPGEKHIQEDMTKVCKILCYGADEVGHDSYYFS